MIGWVNWRYGQLRRHHINLVKAPKGEPENFLITGSDSRAGITRRSTDAGAFLNGQYDAGQRSDSIMILRIDPRRESAAMLSIPRDLFVKYASSGGKNYGRGKINGAFAISPQVLTDTISQNFGISINHFMQVDFVGFQKLVNAIGGLSIYFDTPMRDRHTGLDVQHAGCVKLDGASALAFARSRYLEYRDANGRWVSDNASDFGRIKRQQFLMRHAAKRMSEQGYLTHPRELDALASAFVHTVTVDQGFDLGMIRDLADRFKKFDAEHLKTYTIPAVRWYPAPDGSDALRIDDTEAQPILNLFRTKQELKAPETAVAVKVYNGSGREAQAANVAGALQQVGFRIVGTGNASALNLTRVQSRTQVRYASGDQQQADLVARHFAVAPEMLVDPNVPAGQVTVVTGTDFTVVEAMAKQSTTSTTALPGSGGLGAGGTAGTPAPSTTTTTTVLGRVPPDTAPAGVHCG